MTAVRTAAYCRVSTTFEEQEGSFETQMRYYQEAFTNWPGHILAGIYGDRGVSGRDTRRRPEFLRMLRDCEAGKIDLIVSKSISRFARNLKDCARVIRRLSDLGIGVWFEKERLDSTAPGMEFVLHCMAAIAEEESCSIGDNMRWAYQKRNAAGNPCRAAPYGYRKIDGGRWVIERSEADRVALAFQLASEGVCYPQIRATLNEWEQRDGTGKSWTQAVLIRLLQNEVYIGNVLTNKYYVTQGNRLVRNRGERCQYLIEEHHPALVSDEIFFRVAEMIERKLLWHGRRCSEAERRFLRAEGPLA